MFTVNSYLIAVLFCVITMICWGSWGNTQKLVSSNWRYELYYWDYVIGMVLFTVLLGFTLGSHGEMGRPFVQDLLQVSPQSVMWVLLGGIIFNASNILLSASISLAGMAVAFPLGVGIALVLGVIINYMGIPGGDPILLFSGVVLITIAIICNGVASGKTQTNPIEKSANKKGVVVALIAGVLMSLFYRFVIKGMDIQNFESPSAGMMTPYSAIFVFSIGVLLSNFVFNSILMKKPFVGLPVSYKTYFSAPLRLHSVGILGGAIWALGTSLSYISAGKASPAISYALGQGAPMIAAFWGVFVWHEFSHRSKIVNALLILMFVLYALGLTLIILSGAK
jgi:glucose uptake protein